MNTIEDKQMIKHSPPFFKTTCFGFFLNKNKNQHNYFLVHGHSSWSMLGLRLVKDPKTL